PMRCRGAGRSTPCAATSRCRRSIAGCSSHACPPRCSTTSCSARGGRPSGANVAKRLIRLGAMSDRLVRDFPLFPLGLVALPHELVPLHIFEERYKAMIGECLE